MLINPKKILWPTDFSVLANQAAQYAQGFRDVFGAELHVLHVALPPFVPDVTAMTASDPMLAISVDELMKSSREYLSSQAKTLFPDGPAPTLDVRIGSPWMSVCEYARDKLIDLIVIGTHGRTGLKHVLIGSTAERIVQHAECPVLVIKSLQRDFLVR